MTILQSFDVILLPPRIQEARRLEAWPEIVRFVTDFCTRANHQIRIGDAWHVCTPVCRFVRVGDVYVCADSGSVHTCGRTCKDGATGRCATTGEVVAAGGSVYPFAPRHVPQCVSDSLLRASRKRQRLERVASPQVRMTTWLDVVDSGVDTSTHRDGRDVRTDTYSSQTDRSRRTKAVQPPRPRATYKTLDLYKIHRLASAIIKPVPVPPLPPLHSMSIVHGPFDPIETSLRHSVVAQGDMTEAECGFVVSALNTMFMHMYSNTRLLRFIQAKTDTLRAALAEMERSVRTTHKRQDVVVAQDVERVYTSIAGAAPIVRYPINMPCVVRLAVLSCEFWKACMSEIRTKTPEAFVVAFVSHVALSQPGMGGAWPIKELVPHMGALRHLGVDSKAVTRMSKLILKEANGTTVSRLVGWDTRTKSLRNDIMTACAHTRGAIEYRMEQDEARATDELRATVKGGKVKAVCIEEKGFEEDPAYEFVYPFCFPHIQEIQRK